MCSLDRSSEVAARQRTSHDVNLAIETVIMEQPRANATLDLIARLQIVLTRADLDCGCRALLNGALDRFFDFEARRLSRRALMRARDHKARVFAILELLSDLDQLTEVEEDRTVFPEMALLFDEIGCSAAAAAEALRDVGEAKSNRPGQELPCAIQQTPS